MTNNKPVIWTVVIATVVLIVLGLFALSSLNADLEKNNQSNTELRNDLSRVETALANQGPQTVTVESDFDFDALCDNIDGCDGWYDVDESFLQDLAVDRVMEELTEDDNRDLFRNIEDMIDVDDKDDIDNVDVHKVGDIRVNQQRWETIDDSGKETIVKVDFVVEVEYYEDGSNDDTKTKYFRVQATLTDLEDGMDSSDVTIDSVTEVKKTYVLPSL